MFEQILTLSTIHTPAEHRCVGVLFDADSDEDVQFQTFDVEW